MDAMRRRALLRTIAEQDEKFDCGLRADEADLWEEWQDLRQKLHPDHLEQAGVAERAAIARRCGALSERIRARDEAGDLGSLRDYYVEPIALGTFA